MIRPPTESGVLRPQPIRARTTGPGELSPELLSESVVRLRAVVLLYVGAFFFAGFFPQLICAACRTVFFSAPSHWLPGTISIAVALVMLGLTFHRGLGPARVMALGLGFEVVASFGIAAAEYHDISGSITYHDAGFGGFGLSWVAVWMLLFTVAVPTRPRRALLAAAASASAPPLVFALNSALGSNTVQGSPEELFFSLVFPYLIVTGMAYAGARVVYRLGAEVGKARELGSYRLVEPLGEGGMGEVWCAQHRFLARPAAIKLVRVEGAAERDTLVRRFEREAQATASLRSPHTVELYDFGVAEDATFYYVMELLDGFDLNTMVSRFGPLPPERVVHFLRQVCDSLAEAHEHDLVHRDVKPANVFACRYGRRLDLVKVLDFGMVKSRREAEDGESVSLTAEHRVGGTPAYMAPEQATGEPIDGRADLYAVGCLAYWLLTGRLVFEGRTALETVMQHVRDRPARPSAVSEVAIPPALEEVVLDCLEKEPDRRPASADLLSQRLDGLGLEAEWTPERARRWWDAHRPSKAARREGAARAAVGVGG